MLPLGPVTFYDTAGLDDSGDLGELRTKAARKVLLRSDMAVVVIGEGGITDYERELIDEIRELEIPYLVAFNKADVEQPSEADLAYCRELGVECIVVSAATGQNVTELKQAIIATAPEEFRKDPILIRDLVKPGQWVVCVVPIDIAAPKGRLILPQVQTLRDILDGDAISITVKETELVAALEGLKEPPALVVTDSQAIEQVAKDVPENVALTTFSTLFARYKGDLAPLVEGADALDHLEDGDTVLVGEACSHHTTSDDIGRVKLPRWIREYTGKDLKFEVYAGHDFPEDLERFKVAVHCGACMINRTEMLRRMNECRRRGVPVTNYGVAISKVQGVLERVIQPFA